MLWYTKSSKVERVAGKAQAARELRFGAASLLQPGGRVVKSFKFRLNT